MSYYRNIRIINREIENLIAKVGPGKSINLALLLYEITLNYEISERAVRKRLDLLKEIGRIKIIDDKEIEVLN